MRGFLTQMELAEMIHIQKSETGVCSSKTGFVYCTNVLSPEVMKSANTMYTCST